MHLQIVAVGRTKTGPERELVARYVDRASDLSKSQGFSGPQIIEVPEARSKTAKIRKADESRQILSHLTKDRLFVALDGAGEQLSSERFADFLATNRDSGTSSLTFVIGGADGLDPDILAKAHRSMSLGRATWPHQIARILVTEQIYRALSILGGHPYHRA